MAELASHPDFDSAATTRRLRRNAQAPGVGQETAFTAPSAKAGDRAQSPTRAATVYTETALDRYSFYFFMGTVGAGVVAMVALAIGM